MAPPPAASPVSLSSALSLRLLIIDWPRQTTLKRILREISDLKKEDLGAISLGPSGDSLFSWKATLPGPEGSVYEGGVFNVDINLAHDYPYVMCIHTSLDALLSLAYFLTVRFSAPKMTFRTR